MASTELVVDEVKPVDHHQPKSVEQGHYRKQQGVGVGGKAPDGQVGAAEHGQKGQPVSGQVPPQTLLLVGLHDE